MSGRQPAQAAARPGQAPSLSEDLSADTERFSAYWLRAKALLGRLPEKPARSAAEQADAEAILTDARASREAFLSVHAMSVYDLLTDRCTRFLRVGPLLDAAAERFPGLVPDAETLAAEAGRDQGDKDGVEIDQGIFLAHMLAAPLSGLHLCHAMLLPLPESAALAERFSSEGVLDLGPARLERSGGIVRLTTSNPRVLNAEDDTTLRAMELAVDVATLDRESAIGVMGGATVDNPRYDGRRPFGAGINLTRLYRGRIPYLWFIERDMGFVHKLLRGVARPDALPDDVAGTGIEKPWVAAIDRFAIGGHCQILLCMDHVVASSDAFLSLPARKEGIIPGLANLRLPRFTGDRIARQAIQSGRLLPCDSPEGRLVCDEVVPAAELEQAAARIATDLLETGNVGLISNRRALRVGQEPLDLFRRYCSTYAREQAYCCFSPGLVANLEQNWNAGSRRS